jgi:hypothetical protein
MKTQRAIERKISQLENYMKNPPNVTIRALGALEGRIEALKWVIGENEI